LSHIVQQLGKLGRRVIAVTSPVAGDGKTTTSINLARTLAQSSDSRVLLIDADLRRGSLGEQLGISRASSPGLAGMIADPLCRLEGVVRRRPGLSFALLPAGVCPAMPYEALRSPRVGELLSEARERFDYVLVDTPPVVPVADLRVISEWVDGIFLVVSAHVTPRGLLDEALSAMDPDKFVGIIYNGDELPLSRI
jgi:capsular exopolysaccharide synthesis family protein